jgi:hypothetical protein
MIINLVSLGSRKIAFLVEDRMRRKRKRKEVEPTVGGQAPKRQHQ